MKKILSIIMISLLSSAAYSASAVIVKSETKVSSGCTGGHETTRLETYPLSEAKKRFSELSKNHNDSHGRIRKGRRNPSA